MLENASEGGVKFDTQPKNSPGGILSMLFRKVMKKGGFMPYINILTDRYLSRTSAQNMNNVKRRTKNTLKTNLTSPEMTFKVFIDLIFFFLGAKKMDITIKLTFPNGEETIENISVTPNVVEKDDGGDEDADKGSDSSSN